MFSILLSTPFTIYTQLVNPLAEAGFDDPGAYDNIAYCIEDLPQSGQVIEKNLVPLLTYKKSYMSSRFPSLLEQYWYSIYFPVPLWEYVISSFVGTFQIDQL